MLIFLVFVIFVFLIWILLNISAHAGLTFDSESKEYELRILWLQPIFKAKLLYEDNIPLLAVFLLNKKAYARRLQAGHHKTNIPELNRMKLLQSVKLFDMEAEAYYGFLDPSETGIACGLVSAISQMLKINTVIQKPDFLPENDYLLFRITAKVNIGLTLLNLIGAYFKRSKLKPSYGDR